MSIDLSQYRDMADESERETILERFPDPHTGSREWTGDSRRHSDPDAIRRRFGFGKFDESAFEYDIIPDCLIRSWDPSPGRVAGGTDFVARGKPGSGKSTLAAHLATIAADQGETVIWRGSPSRSEWIPLGPWSRLCLPAGAEVEPILEPKDRSRRPIRLDVDDLERIVREVVRYDDPLDLTHNIVPSRPGPVDDPLDESDGTINIVYPDPAMTNCQEIYRESDVKKEGIDFSSETPVNLWWFAWFIARIDWGPHIWTTWVADEFGEIAPSDVEKDEFGSYQLVDAMRDKWIDARKNGLSIYAFVHDESEVHEKILKKMRWRIQMPTTGNPTSKSGVLGFESVPMNRDIMSRETPGTALMWNESRFEKFGWTDISLDGIDYQLKIKLSEQ